MKLLIDLQALQTGSAKRGIGRYSFSFANALIQQFPGWEFVFLLNDALQASRPELLLENLIENNNKACVVEFPLPDLPQPALHLTNDQVILSKIMREQVIEALCPDVVLILSLFEIDALSTIPPPRERSYVCVAVLYDLIPLSDPKNYLPNNNLKEWYDDRINNLKNADLLLAISEYVKWDGVLKLGLNEGVIINIGAGVDISTPEVTSKNYGEKSTYDILGPYVLYVGGFDKRKNVEKLIHCFSLLPDDVLTQYKLVLAGGIAEHRRIELANYVSSLENKNVRIIITGYIDDNALINVYRNAHLFVFPSLNEGFGLPPLEAMCLGVPTIASNHASLPEVIGNEAALFDPNNSCQFIEILERGIKDDVFRSAIREKGLLQASYFTWSRSAKVAAEFISKSMSNSMLGQPRKFKGFYDFVEYLYFKKNIRKSCWNDVRIINLFARWIFSVSKLNDYGNFGISAPEFILEKSFKTSIPDFGRPEGPFVFSSTLCREQHFHLPLYSYWCMALKENPRLHRKQWEFVYICQVLYERGFFKKGASALGFGVGKEPLVALFASFGMEVMATDLDFSNAEKLGWVATNQHSHNLEALNEKGICDSELFEKLVSFRSVDMNNIPEDIGSYDICWSSCAFEHLGSIRKGLDFVLKSTALLKPGGIAVHTTEFNVGSNSRTLDNNRDFVIFRRRDIEELIRELSANGYLVEVVDYSSGGDELERYVDIPPYVSEPHLRLQLAGEYVATSIGLIIHAPKGAPK